MWISGQRVIKPSYNVAKKKKASGETGLMTESILNIEKNRIFERHCLCVSLSKPLLQLLHISEKRSKLLLSTNRNYSSHLKFLSSLYSHNP